MCGPFPFEGITMGIQAFPAALVPAIQTGMLAREFETGLQSVLTYREVADREIFPAAEATWRIPLVLFPGSLGMAAGGWIAGLIYDGWGYYAPAFAVGIVFNLMNLALLATLVPRHRPMLAAV